MLPLEELCGGDGDVECSREVSGEDSERNPRLSYDISSQQFEWVMMGKQERTRTPQTEEEVGATSQS